MEDLFRSYWWLLFPLAWFVAGSVDQILRYQRHRDTLNLIKTYADKGQEPPAELMKRLGGRDGAVEDLDDDDGDDRISRRRRRRYYRYGRGGGWYSVVLFGVMAVGFGYASFQDIYGAGEAFVIVTFVMTALCLASLVTTLTTRRD
ncbi:MAG: hypothetical protein KF842_10035 [Caulobacter sp.]|nr:hypothetical protein [Caulobacter sp.]